MIYLIKKLIYSIIKKEATKLIKAINLYFVFIRINSIMIMANSIKAAKFISMGIKIIIFKMIILLEIILFIIKIMKSIFNNSIFSLYSPIL